MQMQLGTRYNNDFNWVLFNLKHPEPRRVNRQVNITRGAAAQLHWFTLIEAKTSGEYNILLDTFTWWAVDTVGVPVAQLTKNLFANLFFSQTDVINDDFADRDPALVGTLLGNNMVISPSLWPDLPAGYVTSFPVFMTSEWQLAKRVPHNAPLRIAINDVQMTAGDVLLAELNITYWRSPD